MSRFHSKILALLFVFLLLLMVSACSSTDEMDDSGTTDNGTTDDSGTSSYYLPDTGQTQSYTDTFGEDSDYLIHPPAYRDNGDGTVNDLNTGLMWQQATSEMDWDSAVSYCSGLSLAGYSDWRLPTVGELQSIVDYGEYNPSIDTTAFPGTIQGSYYNWTSTTSASDADDAWYVNFEKGSVISEGKRFGHYARCVRGNSSASIFTDNGDDTVTDKKTGLVWQQETASSMMDWEAALTYCEGLSLANQSDWRLPNVKELGSIVDFSKEKPAIDITVFPGTPQYFSAYNSSTTYVGDTSSRWSVTFYHYPGSMSTYGGKSYSYYVRCVRGG